MSEDKMKLCLITTVLNNKEIQKLHGQKLPKTEGELLEFKFRPDKGVSAKVDEEGFVVKEENEDNEGVKALVDVLKSDEIKNFINEKYDGAVIPFEE